MNDIQMHMLNDKLKGMKFRCTPNYVSGIAYERPRRYFNNGSRRRVYKRDTCLVHEKPNSSMQCSKRRCTKPNFCSLLFIKIILIEKKLINHEREKADSWDKAKSPCSASKEGQQALTEFLTRSKQVNNKVTFGRY